ncbi:hypothetical protein [Bacillus sp. OK048]|uniref:hypothetical protein n=1 Tax=Bacillus sp. OK048 TaxID=1882761 RepID=UPI000883A5F4|nr:hypothetical protein [Bacillus sp. OK048]SDM73155.1 hypothetical protein SAMN05443253_105136 [Bacillus sp. OK048]
MRGKKTLTSTILLVFSIFFLSGCGDSGTAKKMKESIEENDYFTAKQIYEDATNDLSKKKKDELNKTISKVLLEYLQKDYKDIKGAGNKEVFFYNSLGKIEEIGINNKTLTQKIKSYKQELEDKAAEDEHESSFVSTVLEQTEQEGSDKALEYSNQFNTNFKEFIQLVTEVKKGQIELSGVYTIQRYEQISAKVKPLMEKYRTEVNNVPNEEKEAHEIYLAFLDEEEKALLSFEKAINEKNRDVVITETIPYLNSSNEFLLSWAKVMGIPTNK